jgi:hypothetical protein
MPRQKPSQPSKPDYSINLEKIPRLSDEYNVIDFMELLCVSNIDKVLYKSDVLARIDIRRDIDIPELELDDELPEDLDPTAPYTASRRNDKKEAMIDDYFRHLIYRQTVFGEYYPFIVSSDGDSIKLNPSLTIKHKLYLFMLFASNLSRLNPYHSLKNTITRKFETLSLEALRSCLPPAAEIHIFGTSSSDSGGRYASGNFWAKLQLLSSDIGGRLLGEESDYLAKNSGDGGLDIVGWVPVGDSNRDGLLLVFGQCACTMDWTTKQASSSYEKWRHRIVLKSPPSNMAFIPFCFRSQSGRWHQADEVTTILIDRLRFVHLLNIAYIPSSDPSFYDFMNELLAYTEPSV